MLAQEALSIRHTSDGWTFALVDENGEAIFMSIKYYAKLSEIVADLKWFGEISNVL